ncbi:sensor histidine kinase [Aeromonas jandaei]
MQAFNRQLTRLRQLVARQERFSADAAHQLRTPLTIMKTQVEVARGSGDPALMSESLDAMAVRLDHTIALTERLLLLARLKSDECSGLRQRESIELTALVQQACLSRLAQARSKGIDLGYEGEESAIMVAGEPLLLGELCANLLDNAIKYTPTHGTVTARVVRCNGQIWLEVEDSGPGIAPELAEQVWQPFQRLEQGSEQPGAGLGLALVRDIAHYHHGEVVLLPATQLGGLLVRLILPLAKS